METLLFNFSFCISEYIRELTCTVTVDSLSRSRHYVTPLRRQTHTLTTSGPLLLDTYKFNNFDNFNIFNIIKVFNKNFRYFHTHAHY